MRVVGQNYITKDSIVDGPGLRFVIWTQGCGHKCPGCHNSETHDFNAGVEISVDSIKERITELSKNKSYQGVTFSGGDPMYQIEELTELARHAQECGLDVWVYTGFTFEYLLKNEKEKFLKSLEHIDVLVDGPFILKEKSLTLLFKGSKNQRLIDVKKTLDKGKIVLFEEPKDDLFPKRDGVFI